MTYKETLQILLNIQERLEKVSFKKLSLELDIPYTTLKRFINTGHIPEKHIEKLNGLKFNFKSSKEQVELLKFEIENLNNVLSKKNIYISEKEYVISSLELQLRASNIQIENLELLHEENVNKLSKFKKTWYGYKKIK